MEYLLLNDYPHLKSRYEKLRTARRIDGTWHALFKTKSYMRMKLHATLLQDNFAVLLGRALNLKDDELFTIVNNPILGFIVLSRGNVDNG